MLDFGMRIAGICLAIAMFMGSVGLSEGEAQTDYREDTPQYETEIHEFVDVSPESWYAEPIAKNLRAGILIGEGGHFYPHRSVTRGEFVAMLGRLHMILGGSLYLVEEMNEYGQPFYAPHMHWAEEAGLFVESTRERATSENITREEVAVVLVRYIRTYRIYPHFAEIREEQPAFSDQAEIASWAREAAQIMRDLGMMAGTVVGDRVDFRPAAPMSRAETAALFARLLETLAHVRVVL